MANVGVAAYNFDNLGLIAVINAAEKNASKDGSPSEKPVETKGNDVLKKEEMGKTK